MSPSTVIAAHHRVCIGMISTLPFAQTSSIADAHVKALIDDCLQCYFVSAMEQPFLILPAVPMLGTELALPQSIAVPEYLVLHSLYALHLLHPARPQKKLHLHITKKVCISLADHGLARANSRRLWKPESTQTHFFELHMLSLPVCLQVETDDHKEIQQPGQ